MPNSTNEETLAASQRLLDYISGQQKSAPTVAPAAPAADSRPPVSDKKPGRFAHPLKSLSEPFAHRTTPTIGLVYDSDGILLTRTHHLTIGELYLEKLRFVPYPAGTDATNLKESASAPHNAPLIRRHLSRFRNTPPHNTYRNVSGRQNLFGDSVTNTSH